MSARKIKRVQQALLVSHKQKKGVQAPSKPDPIFAAITEAKALDKAFFRLCDAMDRAEFRARKKHGCRPWSLIAWRNYSAIGGREIDDRRKEFLRLPGVDPKKIEEEYRDAKSRERAAFRAEKAWDRRAGLAQQRQELDLARKAIHRAIARIARTRPKTPSGAAAMLHYIKDDMEICDDAWHLIAIASVIDALKSLKGGAE